MKERLLDSSNWRTGTSTTNPELVDAFLERHRIAPQVHCDDIGDIEPLPPAPAAMAVRPHRFSNSLRIRESFRQAVNRA